MNGAPAPASLEQLIGRIITSRPYDDGAPGNLYRNALENWTAATYSELEQLERSAHVHASKASNLRAELEQLERVGDELERARGILRAAVLGADRELEKLGLDVVRPPWRL